MWSCTECKRESLPLDEIEVEIDGSGRRGVCVSCYARMAEGESIAALGLRKQHEAQLARRQIRRYTCVSCGNTFERPEMRLEFGDNPQHEPYGTGYCVWCLSQEQHEHIEKLTNKWLAVNGV